MIEYCTRCLCKPALIYIVRPNDDLIVTLTPVVKNTLREEIGVNEQCDILLGSGSDEIIQMLAMVVAKLGAIILARLLTRDFSGNQGNSALGNAYGKATQ